jgi:hypothetical protein
MAGAAPPAAAPVAVLPGDARETRQAFDALLERHPPSLGRVLKLDPTLLASEEYLQSYPELGAFLAAHPEVAHNPSYYLAGVYLPDEHRPQDAQGRILTMWEDLMQGLAVISVLLVISLTLAWLVRTLIEYRQWNRLSKVQADVHNKLLDRFTANDDLLRYIDTPAGRRFLESTPIALAPGPRAVNAPVGRILWSIQAGVVVAVAGLGLLFVSGRVIEDAGQPLAAMGILAFAIGVGFVLSAVVAFVLSRRLGLLATAPPELASNRHGAS